MAKKLKVFSYVRDRETNKGEPYASKFASFIQAITEAKAFGCDIILIAEPWVIGDTHEEMTESLSHLAGTGIGLQIVAASKAPQNN